MAETVFETINLEADKLEHKRKAKQKQRFDCDEKGLYNYILCRLVVGGVVCVLNCINVKG